LNGELAVFSYALEKKDIVICEDERYLWQGGKLIFFKSDPKPDNKPGYAGQGWIPTLHLLLSRLILPTIVVDMGAVKFVANGADIMRPGIKEIPSGIAQDALVAIVDERNRKPLAVGVMLLSSEEMQAANSGKVIKTVHYVGDDIWKKGAA